MAAPNNSKTVWVLGAGFSQPLGGPLLPDLFRYEDQADLEHYFPDKSFPFLAGQMFWTKALFNWGRGAEHRWENAEEFLSYLDDAFLPSGAVKKDIIRSMCSRMKLLPSGKSEYSNLIGYRTDVLSSMPDLAQHCARRSLAAECHRFLVDADNRSERWRPYREWAHGLSPEFDTVLTFNYDRVLDRLGLTSVLPSEAKDHPRSKVPVLKLHGSVDWILKEKTTLRIDEMDVLTDPAAVPAIASPGRAKGPSVNDRFVPLWDWAKYELEHAACIVFLGYGFPKTDSDARLDLLRAIAKDNPGRNYRRIEIVLGPDLKRPDVQRVEALIRSTRQGRLLSWVDRDGYSPGAAQRILVVNPQPLWVEDYIADFQRHLHGFVGS